MNLKKCFSSNPDKWHVIESDSEPQVTFVCQTGSHFDDAKSARMHLRDEGVSTQIVIPSPPARLFAKHRAVEQRRYEIFDSSGQDRNRFEKSISNSELVSGSEVFVFFNDWGHSSQLVEHAKSARRQLVGWVEGFQDFLNQDISRPSLPYSHCDVILLATSQDAQFFQTKPTWLVGNQYRWEMTQRDQRPLEYQFLVNVNFTYGYSKKKGRAWLSDVLSLEGDREQFYLSRHPSDLTGGRGQRASVGPIKTVLPLTELLITRSGTAVLDAIALRKPFVFYNPYGEVAHRYLFIGSLMKYEANETHRLAGLLDDVSNGNYPLCELDEFFPLPDLEPGRIAAEVIMNEVIS